MTTAPASFEEFVNGRGRWAIPLSLALLPFLLFLPVTLGLRTFYVHDIQHYFYPYHLVGANQLRSGQVPLWNPYAFSGIPLLGDGQSAMLYPPNWLFFILPAPLALNYAILIQFSIAGVTMYFCARHLGLKTMPSLVAACSFMFCGFMTARVVHLSIMSGVALIPLVFRCVDSALVRGTPGRIAAAAGAVALQSVAGHPQIPTYTALAMGLLALVRASERAAPWRVWKAFLAPFATLTGTYVLGCGLAAIQLLPWAELSLASPRAAGARFSFVMGGGNKGADYLLLLFPYLFGAQDPGLFASAPMALEKAVHAWEHAAYVGLLPLALALVAVASFSRSTVLRMRDSRWFTMLWLLLLLLAAMIIGAGSNTPFAGIVYAVPLLGRLREVERIVAMASFSLALLAGFGMQWTEERTSPALPSRKPGPTFLIVPAALVTAATVFWAWFAHQRADSGPILGVSPADLAHLAANRNAWFLPLAWSVGGGALLVWWAGHHPSVASQGLAVAMAAADLGLFAIAYNPTVETRWYAERPRCLSALDGRGEPFRKATFLSGSNGLANREAQAVLAVSWGMAFGVEDINGFNSLQPRRYTDYLFGPQVQDVSYGYLSDPALFQPDCPILPSLNVRFVLVPTWLKPPVGPHLREIHRDDHVRVYEHTLTLPRAFFADRVRIETDASEMLRAVKAPGFDPRRETLVESAALAALQPGPDESSARVVHREPGRIEILAETAAPRLLVLSEMHFPGWRARVDDEDVPIHRANYLFRSVVVPSGAHRVTFVYRPASVFLGAGISALSLAIAALGIARSRKKPARIATEATRHEPGAPPGAA